MNVKLTKLKPFGLLVEPVEVNTVITSVNKEYVERLIDTEHLVVLRGFKSFRDSDDFVSYCEEFSAISVWPFGKVLELVVHETPKDHIFDNSYIPLHWDGMYRSQVPATQVFHCVSAPGKEHRGGTTFVNTKQVLEKLPENYVSSLSDISCTYTRKMEYYDSKTQAPLITKHPDKEYDVIRYCEPPTSNDASFINHPGFELSGVPKEDTTQFVEGLNAILYADDNLYTHRWETGDVVFSDNHTLLHGRESFTKGAPRHIRRVQLLGKKPLDNPHLIYTK
ncbi:Pyoverdine biosynthesis protein PvcB [Tenacibaculum litopenaei]|uniref:TauD/TfdA dioxygenase family protein n=1 Tax=Tenacibaculum litopenaei TaxID=396016 RepID=UPI003895C6C2